MSKVTVLVPAYNHGKFLIECLKSIFQQTRKPDEIIVIDDCSIDNTEKIAKLFKNKVVYIRHKKNLGPVKTFNQGIKKAAGDYILMVPGDDVLMPKIIEKEAAILDANPEIALVFAQAITVKNGQETLIVAKPAGNSSYIGRSQDFSLLLTQGDFIPYMTALVRKSVYQKLGFLDKNLVYLADFEMWLRIAAHYPLAYCAQPLAYYRIHGKNLHLKRQAEDFEKEFSHILKKYLPKNNQKNNRSLRNLAYYNYFIGIAANEVLANNFAKAARFWQKAICQKPSSLASWQTWLPVYFGVKNLVKGFINKPRVST